MKTAIRQFQLLTKYHHRGSLELFSGFDLKFQLKSMPKLPGGYLIYLKTAAGKKLVYIGRSGTIDVLGKFGQQTLKRRLSMKQEGVRSAVFFVAKLLEDDVYSLKIYWFVTFENELRDLPAFVEGQLMQAYFEKKQSLSYFYCLMLIYDYYPFVSFFNCIQLNII
jgi:hypothetical protein